MWFFVLRFRTRLLSVQRKYTI